ncbi:GATA zinc finger domain-containing protein 10-like [Lucilia cuprina]|uniref:GATA zinc finger domain-containing protein 10-like n=1 Tax=Lucilia cuprina TaxID=7375 RepID=UPI001F0616CD|nr:GATA zinc finger domain-containing protein 10-like [Lucilia cuprina]
MLELNLLLYLFIIFNYFHYGGTVNYNPYASNQAHLLHATNIDNNNNNNNNNYNKNHLQQPATNEYSLYHRQNHVETQSEQNLQGNSNYQQMYRYYYTPPAQQYHQQQQQQQLQSYQPTQIWSGPPIVVEDDIQQQYQPSTTDIPQTLYQQHSTRTQLPSLYRNSKVLPPTIYNPQTTRTQFNYNNNNNNNNIVYHRDFRHQIDVIPESQQQQQHTKATTQQENIISWSNQQQQQHQLLEPQQKQHQQQHQPQQFYATNTNLRYNGISNDLISLSKNNVPDYREHFKRYLENNPHRIRPIY